MFDWLRAKPAPPTSIDRVWLNRAARDRALLQVVVRAMTDGSGPIGIVAFFEETRARVERALDGAPRGHGAQLVLADRLGHAAWRGIHVAERHPLPGMNAALVDHLASAAPGVTPVFHSALDEPLLRRFGGDGAAALMLRLGLDEHEPIEHPMVSKSLANARERVAEQLGARAAIATSSRSMEEWLDLYVGPAGG